MVPTHAVFAIRMETGVATSATRRAEDGTGHQHAIRNQRRRSTVRHPGRTGGSRSRTTRGVRQ